jgi:pimeloyl-ACP methyl ester carboxylesterase
MGQLMTHEEFAVFIPMGQERLAAVVCVPAEPRGDLGVVLLPGGYSRTHRNGLWVRAARELAERGFPSVRLDYHGVGDSTGVATFDTERPFDEDALAATRFLGRATGTTRFAMVSTCFGGRAAFAASASEPSIVSITVTPMPLTVPRDPARRQGPGRVRRSLGAKAAVAWLVRRPLVRRVRRRTRRRSEEVLSTKLIDEMTRFLRHGSVWLLWGEYNASLPHLRRLLARVVSALSLEERERIHLEIVPGTELAGFRTLRDQEETLRWAVHSVDQVAAQLAGHGAAETG